MIVLTSAFCILGCHYASAAALQAGTETASYGSKKPKSEVKTVTFNVNLHCKACVNKVMDNISFEKGVKDMKVDLEKHEITVKYDSTKTSVEKLAAVIEKLGYKVKVAE